MTVKNAIANSLLMFVAATCVVLIVKAVSPTPAVPPAASGSADQRPAATPTLARQDGVIVYYMHSNARCPTCRTIEAYAYEAVHEGFAAELKEQKLQWQVVNYEEPGNEHFAKDYEVVAPNVVLVKRVGGKQVAWKGLPEVWEHVGDKTAFRDFVQSSLRAFLQDSSANGSAAESHPMQAPTSSQDPPLPE